MNTIKKIGKMIVTSKVKVIALAASAIFFAATIAAAAANSYSVEINIGGSTRTITTVRSNAYAILGQAGIELGKDDVVDLSEFVSDSDSKINVYPACIVKVTDAGQTVELTGVETVEKTLAKNGYTLSLDDAINCEPTDYVKDGMEIVITRAIPVTVAADGEVIRVNVAGGTVSDALDKAVIAVDDDDIISQPLDTPITAGMSIKVTRVTFKEVTKTVTVPFSTTTTKTNSLYDGQSKTTTTGVNGEKKVTYRDKYVNGKLTESVAVNTEVTKQPVNAVTQVGTKVIETVATTSPASQKLASGIKTVSYLTPPSSLTLNGNVPTSYKRKIVGTASAYSGGGLTATGKTVKNGYIAVNPNQISYGTKMWIVTNDGSYVYGYASAEDTGGFTKWTGNRATLCDLYFATESEASDFGRRTVTIYVL